METKDPALYFSNPRLLAALYFGLLSVVGTILINATLTLFGIKEIVPLFQAILIGMVVASATGALFGKILIHNPRPFLIRSFWIGFIMVIASMPFFALGLTYCIVHSDSQQLFSVNNFVELAYAYVMVLASCYLLFGIWLAIGSGLAAIYLRSQLVYDILHTDPRQSQRLPDYVAEQPLKAAPQKKLKKRHVH